MISLIHQDIGAPYPARGYMFITRRNPTPPAPFGGAGGVVRVKGQLVPAAPNGVGVALEVAINMQLLRKWAVSC